MDFKKLGNALLILGAAVLAGAVAWWLSFYASIGRDFDRVTGGRVETSIFDALPCLYSSGGKCAVVSTGATFLGRTPYEPMVFWFGLAALILGGLIRYTAGPSTAAQK